MVPPNVVKTLRSPSRPANPQLRELSGLLPPGRAPARISFDRSITRLTKTRARLRDFILPGFIDLQINGAYGIDVMAATADDLLRLSQCLAHEGTTAWLPTVITSPLDTIERCDAIIAEAIAAQADMERASRRGSRQPVGASILGMHLEGPFISPQRRGAHPPLSLLPQGAALDRILALKTLKLITLAPELEGALDAIPRLVARDVIVSIGHTDADYEQAVAGLKAGATMLTHLFNAMPPFHHRAPGPIGAATHELKPTVTLIPDGAHVHPAALRLTTSLTRCFVTDRVSFAGGDQASTTLFGRPGKGAYQDGRVVRLADGTLAGSTITMLEAAQTLHRELGSEISAVQAATSLNAAEALRLSDRGRIALKARADLILLDRDLNLKTVVIAGREID